MGIEVFVDAYFAGNWNAVEGTDPVSVLSRSGFMILYANCPLYWSSKLQTEITLSTTDAEYIALSQSLREVIPLINLLGELKKNFKLMEHMLESQCRLFEDNRSCMALAKAPQMNPCTK